MKAKGKGARRLPGRRRGNLVVAQRASRPALRVTACATTPAGSGLREIRKTTPMQGRRGPAIAVLAARSSCSRSDGNARAGLCRHTCGGSGLLKIRKTTPRKGAWAGVGKNSRNNLCNALECTPGGALHRIRGITPCSPVGPTLREGRGRPKAALCGKIQKTTPCKGDRRCGQATAAALAARSRRPTAVF
jgi:hypothetical protein